MPFCNHCCNSRCEHPPIIIEVQTEPEPIPPGCDDACACYDDGLCVVS